MKHRISQKRFQMQLPKHQPLPSEMLARGHGVRRKPCSKAYSTRSNAFRDPAIDVRGVQQSSEIPAVYRQCYNQFQEDIAAQLADEAAAAAEVIISMPKWLPHESFPAIVKCPLSPIVKIGSARMCCCRKG